MVARQEHCDDRPGNEFQRERVEDDRKKEKPIHNESECVVKRIPAEKISVRDPDEKQRSKRYEERNEPFEIFDQVFITIRHDEPEYVSHQYELDDRIAECFEP